MAHESRRLGGEESTGPRFVLRGSTRRGSHEVVLVVFLLGAILLFVVVLRRVIAEANMGAVAFAFGLAAALIGALIYAFRASKAVFVVYRDRVLIDSRPEGSGGRRIEVALGDLRSVMRDGSWIRMRRRDDRTFSFRGDRLHVEDAFDALMSSVDEANPDCVILNRG